MCGPYVGRFCEFRVITHCSYLPPLRVLPLGIISWQGTRVGHVLKTCSCWKINLNFAKVKHFCIFAVKHDCYYMYLIGNMRLMTAFNKDCASMICFMDLHASSPQVRMKKSGAIKGP